MMANHGHTKLGLFPLAMMIWSGIVPFFSNRWLPSLRDLPVIWSLDQFDQTPSIDTTDSSLFQQRSSLGMSFQGMCDFLPWRRLVSGAFSCRRWLFRLSTGEFPLTRGYGGFIWVFDPGINLVLAEEDIIILVIDEITSLYLMEMMKTCRAKWVTSPGLVAIFLFGEDAKYVSDYYFSNRKTEKSRKSIRRVVIHKTTRKFFLGLRLEKFVALMEFLQVCLVFRFYFDCNTIRMIGNLSGVLVKEANTTWRIVIRRLVMFGIFPCGFQTHRNRKRWDLLMMRQMLRGLSERFIRGNLYHNTGFHNLEVCLQHGQRRTLAQWLGWYEFKELKEILVANEQSCIRRFKSHGLEPLQTTYHNVLLIIVMRKAFRSFIYKMIACYECMKRGLNRFILLPVRLLLESRVTSTSSSKLGFNFLYLFQWLYLNGSMYHVSCKTLMQ